MYQSGNKYDNYENQTTNGVNFNSIVQRQKIVKVAKVRSFLAEDHHFISH
eukprot:UN07465